MNSTVMDTISSKTDKKEVFEKVERFLTDRDLEIAVKDSGRPWGGFFVIEESSLQTFLELFFPDLKLDEKNKDAVLSPKILLVEPGKRLSWQYHDRRSEYWTIAIGKVGVMVSDDNQQKPIHELTGGDLVSIGQRQRHRLVGLDEWGIVAEIWEHTDPENPSDEEDIVRLDDDFGR